MSKGAKTNDYSRTRLIVLVRGGAGLVEALVLSKRWLARCQEDRSGVCFCRACCGVARAFLLASFQFASLQHDAAAPRFFWGDAFACGVDEVFRYNGPHD